MNAFKEYESCMKNVLFWDSFFSSSSKNERRGGDQFLLSPFAYLLGSSQWNIWGTLSYHWKNSNPLQDERNIMFRGVGSSQKLGVQ